MRNITKNIKNAISTEVLWSINDFFYFIECLRENKFEVSFSLSDEEWAQLLSTGILIGYIWKKSPLIFLSTAIIELPKHILKELSTLK